MTAIADLTSVVTELQRDPHNFAESLPARIQQRQASFRRMDVMILESCHSTCLPDRRQFRRILKGIEVADRSVTTDWRRYWQLDVDPEAENFCVFLNASRTRMIRTWQHTQDCAQCSVRETSELLLEDIQTAVHV
jgi:hypothetical protein